MYLEKGLSSVNVSKFFAISFEIFSQRNFKKLEDADKKKKNFAPAGEKFLANQ